MSSFLLLNYTTMVALEILQASYWEHFKRAKELALYLPLKNPTRVAVEAELNNIVIKLDHLQKDDKVPNDTKP